MHGPAAAGSPRHGSVPRSSAHPRGPCLWPSFREGVADGLKTIVVPAGSYNAYECEVHELYCGGCSLFLGHKFDDGPASGDTHADARWRHCVLTLSLRFEAYGEVD